MNLRPTLREIIADAVSGEQDMELVGQPETAMQLRELDPDVAIVGTDNPDDRTAAADLLFALPPLRVLMVASTGRSAFMYELRPHRTALGELSAPELMQAIRGMSNPSRRPEHGR
jgi:chemotaxis response regulator CheB